jgi:hypothetical protein
MFKAHVTRLVCTIAVWCDRTQRGLTIVQTGNVHMARAGRGAAYAYVSTHFVPTPRNSMSMWIRAQLLFRARACSSNFVAKLA